MSQKEQTPEEIEAAKTAAAEKAAKALAQLKKEFNIRPLTRGEIKKLRSEGFDVFSFDGEQSLRNMDPVLDLVFPPPSAKIDALPFPKAADVYRAIIGATLGTEEEVKNS